MSTVTPWLLNNTPSFNICNYIRTQMGKYVTPCDVRNMRWKLLASHKTTSFLYDLSSQLNTSGRCSMETDAESNLTHFIFMTNEQKTLCRRFPHFIGIDSTFKSCREKYHLFVIVVDGCGKGIPVCFGWLRTETTASISLFLRKFLEFANPVSILSVMMDDSAATQAAVRAEMPAAHVFLCRVHIIRNVTKRQPGALFMKWFYVAMSTRNRWRYSLSLNAMNRVNETLYQQYVRPRLIHRASMWTTIRSPRVPTFGRRDNNFVEATHRSIKRHNLSGNICLWQAVERTKDVFQHILQNRQALFVSTSRGPREIPQHPELDGMCTLLVPKAVELLTDHLRQNRLMTCVNIQELCAVTEGSKTYKVSTVTWQCDCPFSIDYLLTCRHALYVRNARDNYPILNRWQRCYNEMLPITSGYVDQTMTSYAHHSGVSAWQPLLQQAERKLSAAAFNQLRIEFRDFVNDCSCNPIPPYMIAPLGLTGVSEETESNV